MPTFTAMVISLEQVFTGISEDTLTVMQRVYGEDLKWREDGHTVTVVMERGRYPFRPVCSCGQTFRGYAARHAAQDMADAHATGS